MDAFGMIPNIIATIQATYKVIKFFEEIKSSGLDCNRYISEASSSYIALQQVRERLDSNLADGRTEEPWFRHLQALAGEDGVLKHYTSDMEQVATILIEVKSYRFRRIFVWHREKEKIEEIFKKVERHKSVIQLALSHDQFSLSGHTHEVLNKVEARIKTTASLHATEKAQSDKEKVIKWIYQSAVNHEHFQRDYNAAAQDGTGQAFLSSDKFQRWLEGPCATIFCPGLPGAGKTVMASIVKSHLDDKMMGSNHPTAVLYFNYKRHLEDHTHQTLLLAILAQFLSRRDKVPDCLWESCKRNVLPHMDDIISILESLVQSSHRSFLIMDALDEFYDDDGARTRFLHLIQRIQASGSLRIMMTARPHLTDDLAISKWPDATIEITATADDLHTYLDHKICGIPYLPDDFDFRQSIADRIVEASAGIFLLAVLHSDSLKDAYTEYEVEDILENLSKGPDALDRAYEDATKRIDHQPANRKHYARLTISWMVQCLQPITPVELQHAVTKPEHLERGLSASALVKIDALVSFCAGLITIDHESNVVRFVHYTTQEYFTRDRLTKWLPGAELDPARLCTAYMMNSELLKAMEDAQKSWLEDVREREESVMSCGHPAEFEAEDSYLSIRPEDTIANWSLLGYCKKHWGSHCSEFQKPLENLLLKFLTGPAMIIYREQDTQTYASFTYAAPLGYLPTGQFIGRAQLRQVTPISICSQWGLNHLISKLLDQGSDTQVVPILQGFVGEDNPGWYSSYPFSSPAPVYDIAFDEPFLLACRMGNVELAALLLARTSIRDDVYYAAFRALDEKKDLDMLDLIITRCPLDTISLNRIAMCSSMDESRIKNSLLLRSLHISPDENLEGFEVLFARPSASFWVEYLLEHGLDSNKTYGYQNGIELAAAAGCLENVRVLLNYPDVQVCYADKKDALELAAEEGHLGVFRALLSHVSSIPNMADLVRCSVGRVFERVAELASWKHRPSHVPIMRSLLEYEDFSRLPFNQVEKAIQSVLSRPFDYDRLDGQLAILDVILHHSSIDFQCKDIHGRTLLQTAVPHALASSVLICDMEKESMLADEKYTRTLSMLLQHPSFDFSNQHNPLLEFLTENVVEIDEQEKRGLDIILKIQMLLKDSRFQPDIPDETGRTALSHASEHHAEYLVRMLIQHPLVDVNSRDASGRTPLSYAAGSERKFSSTSSVVSNISVVPILLENNYVKEKANCPDTAGITPLMYSCRLGKVDEVGLLLDVAASEANIHDHHGRTPLLHALEAGPYYHHDCEHEPLAVLLANPNITINAKDKDGRSTLFYAFRHQIPVCEYGFPRERECKWLDGKDAWDPRPRPTKGPNISLLLQHEDLEISRGLLEMRDEYGQALDCNDILKCVKELRERHQETWPYREWTPLNPTESRHLDTIESIFTEGRLPA